jgi:hypothetical protein
MLRKVIVWTQKSISTNNTSCNYSEGGLKSGKHRLSQKSLMQGMEKIGPLFVEGREIAANATDLLTACLGAQASRDLLLHFEYAQIALGLIVGPSRQLHSLHL